MAAALVSVATLDAYDQLEDDCAAPVDEEVVWSKSDNNRLSLSAIARLKRVRENGHRSALMQTIKI